MKEKKPRTAKQLANDERLRAQAAARRAEAASTPQPTPQRAPEATQAPTPVEPPTTGNPNSEMDELKRMVLELKEQANKKDELLSAYIAGAASNQNATNVVNGKVIGTTERYTLNKQNYEDPRPRLFDEPRLKRIAFDTNYELNYEMSSWSYETKDGRNMVEPKFKLQLIQVVLDDDGEPTNQRVGKAQIIFFEDPSTAITMANQLGLPVDEENETKFLNDMRYIRMRDWLFECFWPSKGGNQKSNKREMVIGGQVVETWEVSKEEDGSSTKLKFDQLGSKLRA